jgi:hypothetical protein
MKSEVTILILDTPEEYREIYMEHYVKGTHTLLGEFIVCFFEKDFDHIFSEPQKDSKERKFSKRRAKKIHFMSSLLSGQVETEIMFEEGTGNIAVFSDDLDCVMYLRIIPEKRAFQVMTFFDFGKDYSKMYRKQHNKCIPITKEEIEEKF